MNMALHPDDPPWNIFGLPRIVSCEEQIDRILQLDERSQHGLTFCSGSLGCNAKNDVPSLARKYAKKGVYTLLIYAMSICMKTVILKSRHTCRQQVASIWERL